MAWWGSSVVGPRSRREMRAAYELLAEDTVALSGELGRSRLENVRLGAMVDALAQELGRVRAELTHARGDVVALQRESATIRPLLSDLTAEGRDLRAQLAANQQTVTELTVRLTDLLEAHLEAASRAAAAPAPVYVTPAHASVVTGDARTTPVADLRSAEQTATAGAGGSAERLRLIRHALD